MSDSNSVIAQSAEDFLQKAWEHHSNKQDDAAEVSFRRAIQMSPGLFDAYFGLGLVLKAQGRKQEAIEAFNKVLELLEVEISSDQAQRHMMRRLTLGHINMINSGDWNLEKEIWKRIP